jgi:hypothetical protein
VFVYTLYVEILGIVVLGHWKSPSLQTSQKVGVELPFDLLGSLDFGEDVFPDVDSLLARQLADVGQDSRQKLTVFGHDDGLDISISDQFVQDPKVLLLEVQVLGDLKELLFTEVDNGWSYEAFAVGEEESELQQLFLVYLDLLQEVYQQKLCPFVRLWTENLELV